MAVAGLEMEECTWTHFDNFISSSPHTSYSSSKTMAHCMSIFLELSYEKDPADKTPLPRARRGGPLAIFNWTNSTGPLVQTGSDRFRSRPGRQRHAQSLWFCWLQRIWSMGNNALRDGYCHCFPRTEVVLQLGASVSSRGVERIRFAIFSFLMSSVQNPIFVVPFYCLIKNGNPSSWVMIIHNIIGSVP